MDSGMEHQGGPGVSKDERSLCEGSCSECSCETCCNVDSDDEEGVLQINFTQTKDQSQEAPHGPVIVEGIHV